MSTEIGSGWRAVLAGERRKRGSNVVHLPLPHRWLLGWFVRVGGQGVAHVIYRVADGRP